MLEEEVLMKVFRSLTKAWFEFDYVRRKRNRQMGTITTKVRSLAPEIISKAQETIAEALGKGEATEKEAIANAISILYPYKPCNGQIEALHHPIYRRRDLILIAKTPFCKSMILQAVSVLLQKSTTIITLPLDRI
jgi:hypothetical protein